MKFNEAMEKCKANNIGITYSAYREGVQNRWVNVETSGSSEFVGKFTSDDFEADDWYVEEGEEVLSGLEAISELIDDDSPILLMCSSDNTTVSKTVSGLVIPKFVIVEFNDDDPTDISGKVIGSIAIKDIGKNSDDSLKLKSTLI